MKNLWVMVLAFCLVAVVPHQAEAKRFGGGFSSGKSFSMPKKAAPTKAVAPKSATTPTTAKKPGMGGLMGGLLAGGLLGALFFGGAFEGIQLMDILLVALVAFLLFRLFGAQRRPAYSSADQQHAANPNPFMSRQNDALERVSPTQTQSLGESASAIDSAVIETPEWFDADAFVAGAPEHFKQLQSAWDQQAWAEIATYASPELSEVLKSNRSVLPDNQTTEVVSVLAELANFQTVDGQHVVSVAFHGWIKENNATQTTEFSEAWHLARDEKHASGNWTLVGIEQL